MTGQKFAAVCCTELRIKSSLRTPKMLSRYNTFNSTATELSGYYKALKGTHFKGKCSKQ